MLVMKEWLFGQSICYESSIHGIYEGEHFPKGDHLETSDHVYRRTETLKRCRDRGGAIVELKIDA